MQRPAPQPRCLGALLSTLLGACGWIFDNPHDPLRCDPACSVGQVCFAGQCRSADARIVDGDGSAGQGRWVLIGSGTFNMGSPSGEQCREPDGGATRETEHSVTLTRAFEIHESEVTEAQFSSTLGHTTWQTSCGAACPASGVSWHEAAAYCNAISERAGLARCYECTGSGNAIRCGYSKTYAAAQIYGCPGYRLPTEAEWERAYRATTATSLYCANLIACTGRDQAADAIAWYGGDELHTVKQKAPNKWGLHDMAGNVSEWVHDRLVEDLGAGKATDPSPDQGLLGVQKGGGHGSPPAHLRAAYRQGGDPPEADWEYLGFRCARTR